MNKERFMKHMPTILFATGIVGIFASEIAVCYATIKAERVLREECTVLKPGEDPKKVPPVYHMEDNGIQISQTIVTTDTPFEYAQELFKATWKCFIFPTVTTLLTVGALGFSRHITHKQIAALGAALASAGGLVTKYRGKIEEIAGSDILHDIDREIASEELSKAKSPVARPALDADEFDPSFDEVVTVFDSFTGCKFQASKLGLMSARYFLNRNFAIGGGATLGMFYAFLGETLPREYEYCTWSMDEMYDDGLYWIDIDFIKSKEPDPETGEPYYIIEYGFNPGESEE